MSTTLTKRDHAHALRDARDLCGLFPKACYEHWQPAGSLRRRVPLVGDVEHVVRPAFGDVPGANLFAEPERVNLLFHHLDRLVKEGVVTKHLYGDTGFRWGEKHRGIDFKGFCHEFFTADVDNWGAILAIRTGPGDYSKMLVNRLRANGHENRDGYVWRLADGARVSVPTEEAYFELCGMHWIPPEERK